MQRAINFIANREWAVFIGAVLTIVLAIRDFLSEASEALVGVAGSELDILSLLPILSGLAIRARVASKETFDEITGG